MDESLEVIPDRPAAARGDPHLPGRDPRRRRPVRGGRGEPGRGRGHRAGHRRRPGACLRRVGASQGAVAAGRRAGHAGRDPWRPSRSARTGSTAAAASFSPTPPTSSTGWATTTSRCSTSTGPGLQSEHEDFEVERATRADHGPQRRPGGGRAPPGRARRLPVVRADGAMAGAVAAVARRPAPRRSRPRPRSAHRRAGTGGQARSSGPAADPRTAGGHQRVLGLVERHRPSAGGSVWRR